MKQSSYLSRNFYRRPSIRQLVPDLKTLISVLVVGSESHVGCWIPCALGEDSGLNPAALFGGLEDLEKRGLIATDYDTGELFITFWFRDNTFRTSARGLQARGDFRCIKSAKLRQLVIDAVEASPECCLKSSFLTCSDENQQLTP